MRGWWQRDRRPPGRPDLPPELAWDGDAATIDAAVGTARDVRRSAPHRSPLWFTAGTLLHQRLIRRAHLRATWPDVDEAIAVLRELAAAGPPAAEVSEALGNALAVRYEWSGRLADLDDSLRHLRHATNRTAVTDPRWHGCMANLALTLRLRHQHTRDPADLSSALSAADAAVRGMPPDSPHAAVLHSNLSILLRSRHDETRADTARAAETDKTETDKTGTDDDLARAITHARAAVAAPEDHADQRAVQLSNLSVMLMQRFEAAGRPGDLTEATSLARRALALTPADHPALGRHLASLGNVLVTCFEQGGDAADRQEAIAVRRRLAGLSTAPPSLRITAALHLASLSEDVGDEDGVLEGWRTAVALLPLLAWHGLDLSTRERALGELRGLATRAGAVAARLGRLDAAVELLEHGRCVLWGQSLRLRADLTDLTAVAPEPAERLRGAREGLDGGTTDEEERIRLGRVWDEALAEVRGLPGYEEFLAPLPFARLRAAAAGGPVVLVNESASGDHALIITDRVRVVPLRLDNILERTNAYLEALSYAAQAAGPGGYLTRERFRHVLADMLAWLWEAVALPVLSALDVTGPPSAGAPWPRLWWCPTGALTFLPLHAAGVPGDYLPDRVIPSYATSLTDLIRARAAGPVREPRLLTVGVDRLPGRSPLPEVRRELDGVARLLPPGRCTVHMGADVTRAAVREGLREHSWLHLAGHTQPTPEQPTRSGVLLSDGPLTVLDLVGTRLPHAELAYLSACVTTLGSGVLTDEALHLPAALQAAGYRHVIATQWHIQDHHAADVAVSVYRHLVRDGRPDAGQAGTALHQALTELRRTGHPVDWAPFVHLGP